MPAKPASVKPGRPINAAQQTDRPHRQRNRRLFCDCGRPAIVVKLVIVGSDPQYTVRLALCLDCLRQEDDMELE